MRITGGTAFVGGVLARADVRLRGGRIAEVGALAPETGEREIDARDLYVLPGFVDLHIHGFAGHDCMRGAQDVYAMRRALLREGVAAFLPTTMSAPEEETRAALRGIEAALRGSISEAGAAALGAHMEGPFLSPEYAGAQRRDALLPPSLAAYERLTRGVSCVKMLTLAPELPGAMETIGALARRDVTVCAAHSAATAEQLHAAADAGLAQVSHLFNAQPPFHHRAPGMAGAALADGRILAQVIADGVHLHPDALRVAALCKGAKGLALITDAMEAAGLPDGDYALGGQRVQVRRGEARLPDGTLAGSTLRLHEAVRYMIARAGLPPETVVPMATSTPADALGAHEYGRIAPGCAGVLALMDAEWRFVGAVYEGCEGNGEIGWRTR